MKKTHLYLSIAVALVLLTGACSKSGYKAHLRFEVSDELETKAILNAHTDAGPDIVWEEGDEIKLGIEIYQGEMMRPLNSVDGKLVFTDGSWKTYEATGSSFVERESISVSSPYLGSKVRISFLFNNIDPRNPDPDPNAFVSSWVRVIPFSEGHQTIQVTLPF